MLVNDISTFICVHLWRLTVGVRVNHIYSIFQMIERMRENGKISQSVSQSVFSIHSTDIHITLNTLMTMFLTDPGEIILLKMCCM